MLEQLQQSINDGFKGFHLVFQPLYIVQAQERHIIGYEALTRWKFADPNTFIPLAEQSGLINAIGDWVVDEMLKVISPVLNDEPNVKFFFNLSGKQISLSCAFVHNLKDKLTQYGIPANRIGVELTETFVIEDQKTVQNMVDELTGIGITVALDDYGVGYSGMSRLQELNINRLKIDRSFVRIDDKNSMSIIKNTLNMAQEMGIEVIIEGVETETQLKTLCDMGCHLFQGYLLGKPQRLQARPR
jgi:EAL domain-containing protein (putative c-di-GMP-specific phosphodiesterase class I)